MALAGVGVDIVEIARMERILERTPRFARRVFTDEERAYCESTARPAAHYACRFAAREATLKALGCGFAPGVRFDDVSVSTDASGRPRVELRGRVAQVAREKGVLSVAVSLSFTREMAVAKQRDPRRELAESFREARSVIDELERVTDGK